MASKRERGDHILGVEIFSLCKARPRGIMEITEKIYGNNMYKNVSRVYECMEVLMKHGLLVPQFKNRILLFKWNEENGVEKK